MDEEKRYYSGRVKSWSNVNGFGFIEPTDGMVILDKKSKNQDIFVHFSSINGHGIRNLYRGQEVKFNCCVSDRGLGLVAYNVEPLNAWWEAYN